MTAIARSATRAGLLLTLRLTLRLLAVVVGGYFLSAASVTLGAGGLAWLGMNRSEAVVLMAMLGFVIYLLVLIWGFAERSLPRLLAVTVLAAAAGQALAYWLPAATPAVS